MTNRLWMRSALACSVLLSAGLLAQDNPATTQPANMDLTGLPYGRGVFYKSGADWVVLSHNVLMPFSEGRALALDILNVGSDHATSEMLGAHSGIQIADPRPTFYLHGINPSDVYLVRAIPKDDYREVRMPLSRHYRKWAHFRAVDVSELAITGINGDVIAVRPSADLKPGEYALTAGAQHGDEWLRLGFDFGILAPR
ncbi:MAG TPA: hypothetical protein VFW44_07695 [Bryobacteraceae bacterium]|nr:hypothetical protein [Bryobacteraceae bacterium]